MLYRAFKDFAALCFNLLNVLLGGNLPPFGCVCIVVERDGRLLVIQRPSGRIVLPGGFIRWREHPEQAVVREGKEETGLLLRPVRVLGYYPAVSQSMRRMSTLTLAYVVEIVSGELHESVEGRPVWLDEEQLASRFTSLYQDIFQDYRRDRDRAQCQQHHISPAP